MILAALLIAVSTPASIAAARPSPIETDVEAVKRAIVALSPHLREPGTSLDGKPGTDRLAEAQWRAVQTWAAHWLDGHPDATPDALAKAGEVFGPSDWSFSATSMGHGDVLVSAARWQFGTAFILGRSPTSGYRLRWSIAAPQSRLNRAADRVLSWWRPAIQNGRCSGDCRMMGVSGAERLPDAASGATRFALEAGYAQEMGATVGMQISFWSWQNGRARPLLVHDYAIMADQHGPVLRGATLHVLSKGWWHTLFACGSCYGRETDLRFAVGPNDVRMLAPVSLTPEADLVDRVFTHVLKHQPVGTLASPAALRVIRRQLAGPLHETDPQLKGFLGMLSGWQRWRTHGRRWACVGTDEAGVTAFAFDSRLTRITEARALKPDACQGEGMHRY